MRFQCSLDCLTSGHKVDSSIHRGLFWWIAQYEGKCFLPWGFCPQNLDVDGFLFLRGSKGLTKGHLSSVQSSGRSNWKDDKTLCLDNLAAPSFWKEIWLFYFGCLIPDSQIPVRPEALLGGQVCVESTVVTFKENNQGALIALSSAGRPLQTSAL